MAKKKVTEEVNEVIETPEVNEVIETPEVKIKPKIKPKNTPLDETLIKAKFVKTLSTPKGTYITGSIYTIKKYMFDRLKKTNAVIEV